MNKKLIPAGMYCYESLLPINNGRFKVIGLCPYFKPKKYGAYCAYLKKRSYEYDPFNLIWDQCKECGVKDGFK